MKITKITSFLIILLCFTFVGWRLHQHPVTETESVDVIGSDSHPVEHTAQTQLKRESDIVSAEQNEQILSDLPRNPNPNPAQKLDSEPQPETELLPKEEILVPHLNPPDELLEELLSKYLTEEITVYDIESKYLIPEDIFFDYIYEQNWVERSAINIKSLPEPPGYRSTEGPVNEDSSNKLLSYSITADRNSPIYIYAVDSEGNFSGDIQINEELKFPYQQVKQVESENFMNSGINVNVRREGEFVVMLQGKALDVFPLYYTYYEEGETRIDKFLILTTPDMLASATVISSENRIDMYEWRIDYDGDGKVDFILSHNGISSDQATKMADFVIDAGYLATINEEVDEETFRTGLVTALSTPY